MAELFVALALAVGPTPPSGPSIAWGGARSAWAGGASGILASSDGGLTWRRQTRSPVLQLAATDARHAWAIGSQGMTLRSTDGRHWSNLGVQHLSRISFVDPRHGFALDRDGIFRRSPDGGRTWSAAWGFRLQSICFSDARTGWVARGGTVWSTRDGARSWTKRQLRPARQGLPVPELGCRGSDVWVVFHEGGAAGTEGYHVSRSLDRGATWKAVLATPFDQSLPHLSNYAGAFSVVGHGVAVLQGSCAPCGSGTVTFVRTANGGRTFSRTTLTGELPGPVAFADRRRGLAVLTAVGGRAPSIWRTADGGRSWQRVLTSAALAPR